LSVKNIGNLPKIDNQEDNVDIFSATELNDFDEKYGFKICPSQFLTRGQAHSSIEIVIQV